MAAPAMKVTSIPEVREALERLERVAEEFGAPDLGRRARMAGELRGRLQVEEKAIRLSGENLEDRLRRLGELRRELAMRRAEVRPVLLDATRRLVERATASTLSAWVQEELGVVLPSPPPPAELVDFHHFYYHVQGMRPELTVDLLGLLLPRRLFRWRFRRGAHRLVAEDLDRNVGRIRGDILYRAQETVRAFLAELARRAVAAEDGIERALIRATRIRAGEHAEARLPPGGSETGPRPKASGPGFPLVGDSPELPFPSAPRIW